jgi:hypothetical protein
MSSPLMGAKLFARGVERTYRDLWQRFCDAGKVMP